MSITARRNRQRSERYELILAAAGKLAETEGWEAVTTRRLAGLINYSQPVLYSHFKGNADIMTAVANKGFEELSARSLHGMVVLEQAERISVPGAEARLDVIVQKFRTDQTHCFSTRASRGR
jgi:AcrR family transcriptional regulator